MNSNGGFLIYTMLSYANHIIETGNVTNALSTTPLAWQTSSFGTFIAWNVDMTWGALPSAIQIVRGDQQNNKRFYNSLKFQFAITSNISQGTPSIFNPRHPNSNRDQPNKLGRDPKRDNTGEPPGLFPHTTGAVHLHNPRRAGLFKLHQRRRLAGQHDLLHLAQGFLPHDFHFADPQLRPQFRDDPHWDFQPRDEGLRRAVFNQPLQNRGGHFPDREQRQLDQQRLQHYLPGELHG